MWSLFGNLRAFCLDKPFISMSVDLVRFNSQGKIAQKREYWDTGHLHNHVDEHRSNKKET